MDYLGIWRSPGLVRYLAIFVHPADKVSVKKFSRVARFATFAATIAWGRAGLHRATGEFFRARTALHPPPEELPRGMSALAAPSGIFLEGGCKR